AGYTTADMELTAGTTAVFGRKVDALTKKLGFGLGDIGADL
ncbi:hypothetical protein LCGC14_2469320, partial [marine sediment metagenome]